MRRNVRGMRAVGNSIREWRKSRQSARIRFVKTLYTGPVVNAELLLVMLEKKGIAGRQEWLRPEAPDEDDLNRPAKILVAESDYDRAYALFYTERQDEL
jgi:hypothetical protein